jgi:hypothetical protein
MRNRLTASNRSIALHRLVVAPAAAVVLSALAVSSPAGAATHLVLATVKAPYSCNSPIGSVSAPVTVSGTTPATAAAGAAVKMTGYQVKVHIPAADVNRVIGLTHAKSAKGTVTTLDVRATDAKTAIVNAAKKPISFGPVALVMNKALTLSVPAKPATIGSWISQSSGKMTFSPGAMVLTIDVGAFAVKATCKPSSTETLSTTTVS